MRNPLARIKKLPGVKVHKRGDIGIGISKLRLGGNRIGLEIPRKNMKVRDDGLFSLGEKHDEILHLSFNSEVVHMGLDKTKVSEELVKKLETIVSE